MYLSTEQEQLLRHLVIKEGEVEDGYSFHAYRGLAAVGEENADTSLARDLERRGLCETNGLAGWRLTEFGRVFLELERQRRLVSEMQGALEPFSMAARLYFPPETPDEYRLDWDSGNWRYGEAAHPKAKFCLTVGNFRRARELVELEEV